MPFTPVRKQKVSQQVAESIRRAIVTGEVRPSEPLPSERELAERFGVNRSSVREALHRLEAWGLVQVRQGYATVVKNILKSAGPEILPILLAPDGRPDPGMLKDLLAIRQMFLGWTARQAALADPRPETARLAAIVKEMDGGAREAARLQALDFAFFEELVSLTGNRVLMLLANAIRQVYLERPEIFALLYAPETFDTSPHRKAIDAIEAADADAAQRAMEEHAAQALALLSSATGTRSQGGSP